MDLDWIGGSTGMDKVTCEACRAELTRQALEVAGG